MKDAIREYRLIDVSHTVHHGMITYKGLPGPVITDFLTREDSRQHYEQGTEFHIGRIEMVANTGTYLDSPFHRYPDGEDLAALQLSKLANLEGVVVRHPFGEREIRREELENVDCQNKAVLFHTGWDKYWLTDEYANGQHPFLSAEAAEYLTINNAALVGIDSYNIDDTSGGSRPAHTRLLGWGIPVVEHLCCLDDLPDSDFKFFAVPVKVKNFGTFPVRAFGLVENSH